MKSIIEFKLKRSITESVIVEGKTKDVKTFTWFNMAYSTKTKKAWFVSSKETPTPYEIQPEMVKALVEMSK